MNKNKTSKKYSRIENRKWKKIVRELAHVLRNEEKIFQRCSFDGEYMLSTEWHTICVSNVSQQYVFFRKEKRNSNLLLLLLLWFFLLISSAVLCESYIIRMFWWKCIHPIADSARVECSTLQWFEIQWPKCLSWLWFSLFLLVSIRLRFIWLRCH